MEGYEFTGARHIGKCYGGTPALEESAEVYAYADHGQNGILSSFEKDGKRAYLLVTTIRITRRCSLSNLKIIPKKIIIFG